MKDSVLHVGGPARGSIGVFEPRTVRNGVYLKFLGETFLGEKPPIEAEAGKDEDAYLKNALGELDKI